MFLFCTILKKCFQGLGVLEGSAYSCCHGNTAASVALGLLDLDKRAETSKDRTIATMRVSVTICHSLFCHILPKTAERPRGTTCLVRRRQDTGEGRGRGLSQCWTRGGLEVKCDHLFHYESGQCFATGCRAHTTYMLNLNSTEQQKGTEGKGKAVNNTHQSSVLTKTLSLTQL